MDHNSGLKSLSTILLIMVSYTARLPHNGHKQMVKGAPEPKLTQELEQMVKGAPEPKLTPEDCTSRREKLEERACSLPCNIQSNSSHCHKSLPCGVIVWSEDSHKDA